MSKKRKKRSKQDKNDLSKEETAKKKGGLRNFLRNLAHFGRSRVLNPNKKRYKRKDKHKKDYKNEE